MVPYAKEVMLSVRLVSLFAYKQDVQEARCIRAVQFNRIIVVS